jgi:hypothetical protein
MRTWTGSVARARRYAARRDRRLDVRRVANTFVWLRRVRGSARTAWFTLRQRLQLAFAVHLRRSTVLHVHAAPRTRLARATERERHTSMLLRTRQVTAAGERHATRAPEQFVFESGPAHHTVLTNTLAGERRIESRFEAMRRTERDHRSRLELRQARPMTILRTMPAAWLTARPALTLRDRLHTRSTHSLESRHHGSHTLERVVPLGGTPISMRVVNRSTARPLGGTIKAFATQPRPLAAASAPAPQAVASPPVERIEQSLRETMHVVAEQTVRREIERVLQPGAPQSRRLRESIQSELYDEIVLERERLGER